MRTFAAFVLGSLFVGSMTACSRPGDTIAPANDGVVASVRSADQPGGQGDDDNSTRNPANVVPSESSPYLVGAWKLQLDSEGNPIVDTEYRAINPGTQDLTLEYAFFENGPNGTIFCGCDRDDFPANHSTVYTMFQEKNGTVSDIGNPVFTCTGTSGAIKSIAFPRTKNFQVILDDAQQVAFQTHGYFDIDEPGGLTDFLTAKRMTESGLKGITLNKDTRAEIQAIHDQCNTVWSKL